MVWGLNFAVRAEVLRNCGGFHPDCIPRALQRYQGDGETGLSFRIKEEGLGAVYHPDVAVTHVIPASRLTVAAMEQRGFYQGVCDSYTQIRRTGAPQPAPAASWKDAIRPLKNDLERRVRLWSSDGRAVAELAQRAHFSGKAFHQAEVRRDPALLDWVLRPDYFDYELPAGWRERLNPDRARRRA
jgi:hypothetical protein